MTRYEYLTMQQADIDTVFFAKTENQYNKACKAPQFIGRKIIKAGSNLYGTAEGLAEYFEFMEDLEFRISQECTPQEVYSFERKKRGKSEALSIVKYFFGDVELSTKLIA